MSKFEELIASAQRRHNLARLLTIVAVALILVVALATYFGLTRVGSVKLAISPMDASEVANITMEDGIGFESDYTVWGIKGESAIRIEASGFRTEVVELTEAQWDLDEIDVIMRELPATVNASTTPESPHSSWHVDGVLVSKGAELSMELDSGQYELEVRNPYFESASAELTAERGGELSIDLPLVPAEGEITIISQPSEAEVIVNGSAAGKTPLTMSMEAGEIQVAVSAPGYDTVEDIIQLTSHAREVERNYQLKRTTRDVSFSFSPAGGTIALNGTFSPNLATSAIKLAVNSRHQLRYSKPGFIPAELEFTVSGDEENAVAISLQAEYGDVSVVSDPSVDVIVDGKLLGETPMQISLQTVEQMVTLSREGYRTQIHKVTPAVGAPQSIAAVMETDREYQLRTAPAKYTNSAGIELKLFKNPGAFSMGGRSGEAGRRANEFYREIRLDKAFYAGVYEVTLEQYQKFKGPKPGIPPSRLPVTDITWKEAARFCNWLSAKENLVPVYHFSGNEFTGSNANANGYRMLTESEWEWLARKAGNLRQTRYPWGDDPIVPNNVGNLADESVRGALPLYIPHYVDGQAALSEVGAYTPSPSGIHDLVGNASEWTHDAYSLRPPSGKGVEIDPMDTGDSVHRTIKGSSWRSARLSELRASWRDGSKQSRDHLGFRVGRYLYVETSS